jgi:hypothetical protein
MYKWGFKSQLLALNPNKYLLIQHNTYVFVFYTMYSNINKNCINVCVGIDRYISSGHSGPIMSLGPSERPLMGRLKVLIGPQSCGSCKPPWKKHAWAERSPIVPCHVTRWPWMDATWHGQGRSWRSCTRSISVTLIQSIIMLNRRPLLKNDRHAPHSSSTSRNHL